MFKHLLCSGLALLSLSSFAQNEKGMQIALEQKARNSGWNSSYSEFKMVLQSKTGDKSTREMRLKTLEVDNDGDKSLIVFDRPNDVKGTVFLNHSHINDADEQWLYLPALKRTKTIASRNKSGPFVGSEFSFEDLASFEVGKYQFTYLGEDTIADRKVYKVEQVPVDKFSGYKKRIAWIDSQRYIPLKIEFFDRKGSALKTLTMTDYQLYLDKYWRSHHMLMDNHQTGKSTTLITEKFEFNIDLRVQDFANRRLHKVR
ncbi:outer membrane lipoprotein-sorting protein [Pseudoalteromonas sp. OOF1S-7]|uniref:outer membrane lipoprotein-sorting protein n=1 Tax=Pseudoalteromonas sp. OOF1S-7 TaxID=2917757 RepID=UPI001EF6778F|nr:outer membrane lipoprotein-sorting protein [Pseudoalteromonas sp. OOF1S-7]MCG7537514.1 outer membrane lipoprotein-sorting protein [Pseudoalteromonas sp. OOF1S-7]